MSGLTCGLQGNASASATAVSQALSQGASAPTIGQAVGQVVTHVTLSLTSTSVDIFTAYGNLYCRLAAQCQKIRYAVLTTFCVLLAALLNPAFLKLLPKATECMSDSLMTTGAWKCKCCRNSSGKWSQQYAPCPLPVHHAWPVCYAQHCL